MAGLDLLARLLDPNAPQVARLPRLGKGPGNTRKLDRQSEFDAPVEPVTVLFDAAHADQSVTAEAVQAMAALHAQSGRIVAFKRLKHSRGELSHYFDSVWVLSGDEHERLICYKDGNRFLALFYCPDVDHKDAYSAFLDMLHLGEL